MPQIRLDDTGETIAAEDGQTILDALLGHGIAFPHSCQAGNCASCKCELVDGDIMELGYSEHALPPEERAQGLILACRTQVWGDTTIRRVDADELVLHPSRILPCKVTAIERLTHDISELRIEQDEGAPFMFSAGQYAQVEFGPGMARHYSMANTPSERAFMFQIRHMPSGRTSSHVATQLKVGDAVTVRGPHGTSYLRDAHAGPVLLIAGGSGLAPIESILRTLLGRGYPERIALYFGVRAGRDVYHEALLEQLAQEHDNFRYEVVLSETPEPGRRSGFVHDAVASDYADLAGFKAYLAGPPVMVEAATEVLKSKGMAQRDIHADAFYNQDPA